MTSDMIQLEPLSINNIRFTDTYTDNDNSKFMKSLTHYIHKTIKELQPNYSTEPRKCPYHDDLPIADITSLFDNPIITDNHITILSEFCPTCFYKRNARIINIPCDKLHIKNRMKQNKITVNINDQQHTQTVLYLRSFEPYTIKQTSNDELTISCWINSACLQCHQYIGLMLYILHVKLNTTPDDVDDMAAQFDAYLSILKNKQTQPLNIMNDSDTIKETFDQVVKQTLNQRPIHINRVTYIITFTEHYHCQLIQLNDICEL